MDSDELTLTKEDFDATNWQDVIAAITPKECDDYYRPLLNKGGEAQRGGDEKTAHVFRVLGTLAALHMEAGAYESPFANRGIFDADNAPFDVLAGIAPEVTDPEMRARISDFLWVERHSFPMARLAIQSYLDAADCECHRQSRAAGMGGGNRHHHHRTNRCHTLHMDGEIKR